MPQQRVGGANPALASSEGLSAYAKSARCASLMTRSAALTCSMVDMSQSAVEAAAENDCLVGRIRIPVLTQEFVLFAIIAVAVVSLLLLDYSTT